MRHAWPRQKTQTKSVGLAVFAVKGLLEAMGMVVGAVCQTAIVINKTRLTLAFVSVSAQVSSAFSVNAAWRGGGGSWRARVLVVTGSYV